jgi:hypothetical protein
MEKIMAKKKAAPAKPTIDQRIDAFSISEERLDNAIENLKYALHMHAFHITSFEGEMSYVKDTIASGHLTRALGDAKIADIKSKISHLRVEASDMGRDLVKKSSALADTRASLYYPSSKLAERYFQRLIETDLPDAGIEPVTRFMLYSADFDRMLAASYDCEASDREAMPPKSEQAISSDCEAAEQVYL